MGVEFLGCVMMKALCIVLSDTVFVYADTLNF